MESKETKKREREKKKKQGTPMEIDRSKKGVLAKASTPPSRETLVVGDG